MMASLQRALRAILLLVMVLVVPVSPAFAQEEDPAAAKEPTKEELAAARQLFQEGKKLESGGDWSGALERFEKVSKVKMTPQVRFHVAFCHEHLGRMVEAINGFELAAQEAQAVGAGDVIENAPRRAAALRERVAHVKLNVTGTVHTSKVLLDGREVSLALSGTSIPVDPGPHQVDVRRGKETTFSQELTLAEAETITLDIAIDDPEPPPDPDPDPNPDPDPDKVPPDPVKKGSELDRLPAYIAAGVGVVALIASAALWGLREETVNNIAVGCDDPEAYTGCNPDDVGLADTALQYDTGSKVLLGVGLAAVAAGVVMWFLLEPKDGSPTTGTSSPRVGVAPAAGGLQLVGQF